MRIAAEREAVLGADDPALGTEAREGLAERGVTGAEEIAERVTGERSVGGSEGGEHAFTEVGDVLRMIRGIGVDDAQVRSGFEREFEMGRRR